VVRFGADLLCALEKPVVSSDFDKRAAAGKTVPGTPGEARRFWEAEHNPLKLHKWECFLPTLSQQS